MYILLLTLRVWCKYYIQMRAILYFNQFWHLQQKEFKREDDELTKKEKVKLLWVNFGKFKIIFKFFWTHEFWGTSFYLQLPPYCHDIDI